MTAQPATPALVTARFAEVTPSRYALVVALDRHGTVATVRAIADDAVRAGRLWVLQGDERGELFPTRAAAARLRTFYNRGGSAPEAADRVREVAIVFYHFFPAGRNVEEGRAAAHALARDAGFAPAAIQVLRADSVEHLAEVLGKLGHRTPLPDAPEPGTFAEAVEQFAVTCADDAVVAARARESATGWDYPDPGGIFRDLMAVHRVYGRLVDQTGAPVAAANRKAVLFTEIGQTLAGENPTVTRKYRRSVFAEMGGREIEYPLHLKYGERTRLYFWFASTATRANEPKKTLLAHAGCHLPTGSRHDR